MTCGCGKECDECKQDGEAGVAKLHIDICLINIIVVKKKSQSVVNARIEKT